MSAAIHLYPNRPAWLTDEMLPLPEGTERLYRDRATGNVGAYPCGRVWFEHVWAIRAVPEYACVKDGDEVYHVPPPAPVAKAEPAGETAYSRWMVYSQGIPFGRIKPQAFNAFVASEVAAAKAKPHAETAEVVNAALYVEGMMFKTRLGDRSVYVLELDEGRRLRSAVYEYEAAIKRERGEA